MLAYVYEHLLSHSRPRRLVAECFRDASRIVGDVAVVVGFVSISGLHGQLQSVLLLFLLHHLLKGLRLRHLFLLLLRAELDKHGLVDPLESSHFGLLGRVDRVAGGFEVADIGLPLGRVRPNGAEGLKAAGVYGIRQVDGRALSRDRLLTLRT